MAATGARGYPVGQPLIARRQLGSQSGPIGTPSKNLASGFGGPFADAGDPVKAGPPKTIHSQDLGSVVGRRGAGISQITGGDQVAHSVNQYSKNGFPPAPDDGTGGGMGGGGFGGSF